MRHGLLPLLTLCVASAEPPEPWRAAEKLRAAKEKLETAFAGPTVGRADREQGVGWSFFFFFFLKRECFVECFFLFSKKRVFC